MAKGLAIPMRANPRGGFATVEGEANDQKIIHTALSDDDNENAFQQDIGLGQFMIFNVMDPGVRARIYQRLEQIFGRFQALARYKLLRSSIEWTEDSVEQELTLQFRYVNLETDEEVEFRKTFSAG